MNKFGKFAAGWIAVLGAFGAMAEDNPFAGYDHKAKITFGGYAGESTLTNFPALVRLTEGVGGFSYADCAQENGGDVRFTRGDGVELASECVKWDTTGESQFWVRVPELTSDTVIYMCWGNADAAKRDQRLRVWDRDYTAVWSMDDAGKGIADKSGRGNYGNSSSASTGAAGVAGVARQFASANSEWAQAGHGYNDSFCGPQVAYECWYNLASYPTSQRAILAYSTMNGDFDSRAQKRILQLSTKGVPCFAAATSFNGTGTQPELGTWHHAMVALDVTGKTCDVYMDGQRVGGGAFTKAENTVNQYIRMQFAKANYSGASGTYFDGSLDEVRVSRVVRSADYAAAVFLNAASNDLFMAIASVDALPEIDPPAPRKFTFTISAEAGGTVTPSGTVQVEEGGFLEVAATASSAEKAFYAWGGNCPTTQVFSAKVRIPADCDRVLTARFGTAYYVSPDGSDTGTDGRSVAAAKATIGGALAQIDADFAADESVVPAVVLVGEGTYGLTKAWSNSGTPEYAISKAIAVRSKDGVGKAVVDYKNTAGNCGAFSLSSLGAVVEGMKFINIAEHGAYSKIFCVAKLAGGHLLNCIVDGYKMTSSDDHVVYIDSGWVSGCVFRNSSGSGGTWCRSFYVGPLALVDSCVFTNITSAGVSLIENRGTIRNCLFASVCANNSSSGSGGAISFVNHLANANNGYECGLVENCTFVNCKAAVKGGAVYSGSGPFLPSVVNCAFSGNLAATPESGPDVWGVNLFNCLSLSCDGENGNIVGEPSFVAAATGDYSSTGVSLTRDAGAYADWATAGTADVLGTNRVEESAIDIGCFEFPKPAHESLAVNVKVENIGGTTIDSMHVKFTTVVTGDATDLAYDWNFGDGTTSDAATPEHTYAAAGYYTVTLTIVNGAGERSTYTGENVVKVMPSKCYVRAVGQSTPVEPYATPATAANDLKSAVALAPRTIDVGEGNIPIGGVVTLNFPVSIIGRGPTNTFLTGFTSYDDGYFGVYVSHAEATLAGMDLSGCWGNWGTLANLSSGMVTNCVFRNNGSNNTGAMVMTGGKLVDCTFSGNSSPHRGTGALVIGGGGAQVLNCVFSGNTGHQTGGALRIGGDYTPAPVIRNCLFLRNSNTYTASCSGGAIAAIGRAVIDSCTVVSNSMEYGGRGGIYVAGNGVGITNTIAWGNVAHQTNIVDNLDGTATTNVIWAADDIFVSAGKSAILSHCCAADIAGLASEQVVVVNSLAADPLFNLGKKANLPYWGILGGSPCKNAGKKLEWMTEGTTDLVGNPRVFGGKPDLGCYESLSGGMMLIVR